MARGVKPGGRILLLEHVRIDKPTIGTLMDWLNAVIARLWGANVNRRTVENVQRASLQTDSVESLGPMGMVKLIRASTALKNTDYDLHQFSTRMRYTATENQKNDARWAQGVSK